jgi:hypothetical protein
LDKVVREEAWDELVSVRRTGGKKAIRSNGPVWEHPHQTKQEPGGQLDRMGPGRGQQEPESRT